MKKLVSDIHLDMYFAQMTVLVISGLTLITFLPYVAETAYTCPKNSNCISKRDCRNDINEAELFFPCAHNRVCCPSKNQARKPEPFNLIPTTTDAYNIHHFQGNNEKFTQFHTNSSEIPESSYNASYIKASASNDQSNINRLADSHHSNNNTRIVENYTTIIRNSEIGGNGKDNIRETNFGSNTIRRNGTSFENTNNNNDRADIHYEGNMNTKQPTTEDSSDQIRFNIPDFNNENYIPSKKNRSTSENEVNNNDKTLLTPTHKHKNDALVRSNDSSIVARRKLFKTNCGLTMSDNKITGGQAAELGQFPWMALLGFRQNGVRATQFLCGGSLITSRHILTAAHCIEQNRPLKLITVRLGEYNLTSDKDCVKFLNDEQCADEPDNIWVENWIIHPQYSAKTLKNDIAIIKIVREVRESDYIRTICLPFDRDFSKVNLTGQNFTVSGWGKTNSGNLFGSDSLQFAKVTTWDHQKCEDSLPPEIKPLSPNQLCANGPKEQDSCKGDSGGPLINTTLDRDSEIRHIQIGIVSFGTSTCGDHNLPTIYTRVDKYLPWILENVT